MPGSSEAPVLEDHLAARLLAFDLLDETWPKGRTAIERAEISRQREDALSAAVPRRWPMPSRISGAAHFFDITEQFLAVERPMR